MKRGQAPYFDRFNWIRRARDQARGLVQLLVALWAGMILTDPLLAAIDPSDAAAPSPATLKLWTVAQSAAPPTATGDAVVPPVRREPPAPPPAAAPAKPADTLPAPTASPTPSKVPVTPPPPEMTGVFGTIQEWLSRANREYQGVVVKELSLPGPDQGEDEIAKKLKEQQAEDAQKAAAAKRAEDAARQAADDKAAAAQKAAEAKKLDEDRRRAEETKRLADEAKKKADELLKAEQPAAKSEPKAEVAAPVAPAPPNTDDANRLAEQQRREAQKLADESKRQEQMRKEQQARDEDQARKREAQRKADETRRLDEERRKADAARAADTRRATSEPAASRSSPQVNNRTIVLTPEPLPEPIVRPVDPGTRFRPEMSSRVRTVDAEAGDNERASVPQRRRIRVYHEATYRGITPETYRSAHRGTAVKRWVMRSGACSAAGRRISPPARYTVKRGDSLWRISEKHYHHGRLYPKIYSANRAIISDPDLIYPCQRVLVPRRH